MENKKNGLVIVLVVIIAVLCLIIGWLLGNKFSDKENEILDDLNNTETKQEEQEKDLTQIINCTGTSAFQYGEISEIKKYIFNNNVFAGIEVTLKYDFGTEDLAKSWKDETLCGGVDSSAECNFVQDSQYVNVNIKINEDNLNNVLDYTKYKSLTIDDILNNNVTANDIFNNENMTCVK